jgi:hypothetical protein
LVDSFVPSWNYAVTCGREFFAPFVSSVARVLPEKQRSAYSVFFSVFFLPFTLKKIQTTHQKYVQLLFFFWTLIFRCVKRQ